MMKSYTIFFTLLILVVISNAQVKPTFEQKPYRDSANNLYWNRNQPVYVFLSPSPDGSNPQRVHSKATPEYADPFYFDGEGLHYIRHKYAVDRKTGKTVQAEALLEVYADGIAPATSIHYLSKNISVYDKTKIFGKDLKINLTAFDATSKVKDIYYSLNGQDYRVFAGEIPINNEGKNTIKFFSVDNVGNVEETKEKNFYVDITPPSSSVTVTGISVGGKQNIISLSTKIYIESTDNLSGVKHIYYQIDSLPKKLYQKNTSLSLIALKDGEHILKFYAVDKVNNVEQTQTFNFYLDRTAPITVSDILGDKFLVGDKIYFSGRTKMKITSIDNKAGVKQVLYSIDGGEFKEYTDPFYMPNEPGWHIVKYFALDSTENLTKDEYNDQYLQYKLKVDKIYVDLTGPSLSHFISGNSYTRNDTTFIGPNSEIHLSAKDAESGLQLISYSIDGELKEHPYNSPFTLQKLPSGHHHIEYYGYDNVNNRNVKSFDVILDNSGPKISHKFSVVPLAIKDSLEVYPSDVYLFISVQDDMTGVTNITYSLNGSQKLLYKNYIKGFKKGENVVKVEAYDMLKNKSEYVIKFLIK